MSIFDVGQLIRARVYKRWDTNTDRVWSNTYEFVNEAATSVAAFGDLANGLGASEASIHTTKVEFDRVVFSTWTQEGNYFPENFITVNLEGVKGARSTGSGGPLDLRNVLQVNFNAETGRAGRRLYRGALTETDVAAINSGLWGALDPALQTAVGTAFSAMVAQTGFYASVRPVIASLLAQQTILSIRNILSVGVKGATTRQLRRGTSSSG